MSLHDALLPEPAAMTRGSAPSWPLCGGADSEVSQDVVQIDARGRICLPAWIWRRLPWGGGTSAVDCLMVLHEEGRLELRPWEPDGERVLERRGVLLVGDLPAGEQTCRLWALEDRYLRGVVDQERRITLPAPALLHLHLVQGDRIYVRRMRERLELISPAWRRRERERMARLEEP